jgi:Zn-dependent protease
VIVQAPDMLHFFLYGFILIVLFLGIRYAFLWSQILRSSFRYPHYIAQPIASLPSQLQEVFERAIIELSVAGFELCGYYLVERMDDCTDSLVWEVLLWQPQFCTYARVGIRRPIEAVDLFDIDFYTKFEDGTWLMTVNGRAHGIVGRIPRTILQDAYAARSNIPWRFHLQRLRKLAANHSIQAIEPREFILALEAKQCEYIDYLQRRGKIVPQTNRSWQIHWWTAILILPKVDRGLRRLNRMLDKRRRRDQSVDAIPIALELDSFLWMERYQQKSLDPKLKFWLLFGSFILFIASYIQLISLSNLIILIAVLLLHEAGHIIAMKLCGYRQHYLVFLPFLGAVAAAKKENATMVEKTIVSLAGPLPGLILGIILAISTQSNNNPEWLNTTIYILISLNVFNLLPIYPLDGGQVADLLLFSRHPYSDVLFKFIGGGLFVAVGFNNPIAFIFAVIIALSIPGSFRTAKLHRQMRQEVPVHHRFDREQLLVRIFHLLDRTGDSHKPFSHRYLIAQKLLQRHHENQTNWLTRISLGTIYTLSLLGGLGGSAIALIPELSFPWKQDGGITSQPLSRSSTPTNSDAP